MKALTTMLAERAMAKQDAPADGLKAIRDAAQAEISEAVIDACSFSRPSSYAANVVARQFGILGRMAHNQNQKSRAAGLPAHFVLAVTEDRVVALEETFGTRGGITRNLGAEVAAWQRSALVVATQPAGHLYHVTLSSPGRDDVECSVAASALTRSFLDLLTDPARRQPATAA